MFGTVVRQARGVIPRTWPIARDTRNDSAFWRSVSIIALLDIKLVHVWNRGAASTWCDAQNVADSPGHENHGLTGLFYYLPR
jgi:hypothetical protein